MIEDAAASGGQTAVEARFALLLLYNREGRYAEAMRVTRELQQQFPRNRLLWLEAGATLIRARQYEDADAMLSEGIQRLATDGRERMFGEEALWHYKRAVARARLGRVQGAREDLQAAFARQARDWVRGRSHAELGQLHAKAGEREQARREYRLAIESGARGNDPVGVREAEALMRQLR
jgi:tetratricopeptide (TPR) repeat protein